MGLLYNHNRQNSLLLTQAKRRLVARDMLFTSTPLRRLVEFAVGQTGTSHIANSIFSRFRLLAEQSL